VLTLPVSRERKSWSEEDKAARRESERKGKSREEHSDLSRQSVGEGEEKWAHGAEGAPFLSLTLMLARPSLPHFNSSFLGLQEALARDVDIFLSYTFPSTVWTTILEYPEPHWQGCIVRL